MDKGSKFHAYAFPVANEEEAQQKLAAIRKSHPKARHFCTALRLHVDASMERSNDDGEPSGTAGKPILGQLVKNNITNVLVIVVRYFGGTKLGIPGLIEAYKTSTANAIDPSNIVERVLFVPVEVTLPYDNFPAFLNFCKQRDIRVFDETFAEDVTIVLGFRKSYAEKAVTEALHQFTNMDFETLKEYEKHLDMSIVIGKEETIG